ncbi:MAG: prephenate dehydratase [Kiritimatiellia bacterium]
MKNTTVTFLGPSGTYSHLVAQKRFAGCRMLPQDGILDVCAYIARHPKAYGIVPIENSSGGTINETVDVLLDETQAIHIHEEIALHVKLALLGHKGKTIKRLYSHFVPLEHCAPWINSNLPGVHKQECDSTAAAAARTAADPDGAALCSRFLAKRFNLELLEFPVESSTPNVTTFIVIAHRPARLPRIRKTTLALCLPNTPGSLYRFLGTLQTENINLSRLVSRPIRGRRQEYAFLVDLDADAESTPVKRALQAASIEATSLRICGSFPSHRTYQS